MAKIIDLEGVLEDIPEGIDFCFGYLEFNDTLYLGRTHHAQIIAELIGKGITWEQLLATPQLWGWGEPISSYDEDSPIDYDKPEVHKPTGEISISFSTDEAKQDISVQGKTVAALEQAFPDWKIHASDSAHSTVDISEYGDRAKRYYLGEDDDESNYYASFRTGAFVLHDLDHILNYLKESEYDEGACFGLVGNEFYLGTTHHAEIIAHIIQSGVSWQELMNAEQAWGWFAIGVTENYENETPFEEGVKRGDINLATDDAYQSPEMDHKIMEAFHQFFPEVEWSFPEQGENTTENYGQRAVKNYGVPKPSKVAAEDESRWSTDDWKNAGLKTQGCFGYVDGHLVFGSTHHQMIIAAFLNKGWSWSQLNKASQAWGWYYVHGGTVDLQFTSDAGFQNDEAVDGAKEAFRQLYHLNVSVGSIRGVDKNDFGTGLKGRGLLKSYLTGGRNEYEANQIKGIPEPPPRVEWTDEKQERLDHLQERQNSGEITPEESAEFVNLWIEEKSKEEPDSEPDLDAETSEEQYCQYCDEYYDPDYEEHDHTEYCNHCDEYYDPEEESHDHDIEHCKNCDTYYDANNSWEADEHDHFKVVEDWKNTQTQQWFQQAVEQAEEYIQDGYTVDPKNYSEVQSDIQGWLIDDHEFDHDNAEWLADAVAQHVVKQHSKVPNPSWMPPGLHTIQPNVNSLPQPHNPKPINPGTPGATLIPPGAPPLDTPIQLKSQAGSTYADTMYIVGYQPNGPVISYYDSKTTVGYNKYPISWQDFKQKYQIKTSRRLARVTDLHDDKVFAILAYDYLKLGEEGGAITQDNNKIEVGSNWIDPNGLKHTVTSVADNSDGSGRVYYNHEFGHGNMSQAGWGYYMKPLDGPTASDTIDRITDSLKGLSPGAQKAQQAINGWKGDPGSWREQEFTDAMGETGDTSQAIDDPQVEGAFKDDPRLLQIERNSASAEWRWSMDDNKLHIWRVLNRWQYGPSHYDMFGSTGYKDHSQGRVYVSTDGQVGVLYWQISHDNAEQTLNDWVEQKFGKQPDMVYRAYGPYKGYKTPRYDFPIVEVNGLPIHPSQRWWEKGGHPDRWYREQGIPVPSRNQGQYSTYPAAKDKVRTVDVVKGDQPYAETATKAKRRNRRSKNRSRKQQYRNRGRR